MGIAIHKHKERWYLCDRTYVVRDGRRKQRHRILESYGEVKPTLFRPLTMSGLAEDRLDELPFAIAALVSLDPPYGMTGGEWDRPPRWPDLARKLDRVTLGTAQIFLHGYGEMLYRAVVAFLDAGFRFRFEVAWVKHQSSSWISDFHPLHRHESIAVMSKAGVPTADLTFNRKAIETYGKPYRFTRIMTAPTHQSQVGWTQAHPVASSSGRRWPTDVLEASSLNPAGGGANERTGHYAQKPTDVVRYFILGLTNPGDVVIDPYAGSGTALEVAARTARRAIGIEASPRSFDILMRRMEPFSGFQDWTIE